MSETFEELGRRADQARQLAEEASLYLRVHREKIGEGITATIDFPGKPHTARQGNFLKRVSLIVLARANVLDAAEQVASELQEEARLAVAELRGEFERMANGVGVERTDTGNRTGGPLPSADPDTPAEPDPTPEPPPPGAEPPGLGEPPPGTKPAPAPYRNGNRRNRGNG